VVDKVEYLLIGPREDLEECKSAFAKAGKKAAIFDPEKDPISLGISLLRKTSGAVATFGVESIPIRKEFVEELVRTVRKGIPSTLIVQPYQFYSPSSLIAQITKIVE